MRIRLLDLGYLREHHVISAGVVNKNNLLLFPVVVNFTKAFSPSDQTHFCLSKINHERQISPPTTAFHHMKVFPHCPVLSLIFCSPCQQAGVTNHKGRSVCLCHKRQGSLAKA
uniref:Uncharacterized protein n=1 Tax=Anas platyrhynchos TaxID=8839 RepID=A0A8B9TRT2_ANAPL